MPAPKLPPINTVNLGTSAEATAVTSLAPSLAMLATPITALILSAALTQATVQMPVDDPLLPTGPLMAVGSAEEGEFYVDLSSFARSDIPDTIDITTVIVRRDAAEPLLVALTWVNCAKGVYQISTGRAYDAAGRQVRRTSFVRDKPIAEGSAPARLAAAYCSAKGPGPDAAPTVADYRAALAGAPH